MPATGGIPTLSQVRSWNTEHLTEAAVHWTRTAVVWEDSFTELANQISVPGGTAWEGAAADAAFASAHADRMIVIGLADELHAAAQIARTGANQIDFARSAVLRVVEAAEAAGFVVAEDFSVTCPGLFDPITAAARQAQAEAIATDLRATVGTLVATDTEVAASLTAATSGLGNTVFPESEDAASTVQLVDFKTAPNPNPGTPDDPVDDRPTSSTPSPLPLPSPSWPPAPLDPEDLDRFGNEGDVIEQTAKEAQRHPISPKIPLEESGVFGKWMGRLGTAGEVLKAGTEGKEDLANHKGWKTTLIDVVPKTVGAIQFGSVGAALGAANGARLVSGLGKFAAPPGQEGLAEVVGGLLGAAGGGFIGAVKGGELGASVGRAASAYLHSVLD
jgi:hypothetical protein